MAALKHGRRFVSRPPLSVERLEGRCTPASLFVEFETEGGAGGPIELTNPDAELAIVAEEPSAEGSDPTASEPGEHYFVTEGPFEMAPEDWTVAFPWEGELPSDDLLNLMHEVKDIAISANEDVLDETTVEILSSMAGDIPREEAGVVPPNATPSTPDLPVPPRTTRRPALVVVPPPAPPAEAPAPVVLPVAIATVPLPPTIPLPPAGPTVRYVFSDSLFATTTFSESSSSPAPAFDEMMPDPKMPPNCRLAPETDVQGASEQTHDERAVTLTAIVAPADAPSTAGASLLGAAGMAGLYKRKRSRRSKRRRSEM